MSHNTPESSAERILAAMVNKGLSIEPESHDSLVVWTKHQIEAAVRAERAACADLALSRTYEGRDDGDTARRIAAAIKQRGWRQESGYYMVAHLPQDKIEGLATRPWTRSAGTPRGSTTASAGTWATRSIAGAVPSGTTTTTPMSTRMVPSASPPSW